MGEFSPQFDTYHLKLFIDSSPVLHTVHLVLPLQTLTCAPGLGSWGAPPALAPAVGPCGSCHSHNHFSSSWVVVLHRCSGAAQPPHEGWERQDILPRRSWRDSFLTKTQIVPVLNGEHP